ncbi:MAG: rRNA pseudouridine synthase [Candidatus Omnitrophica bacterium]|nr:rRNA pseudouridine synthase [Candidatus Omnitrophota bacterium]
MRISRALALAGIAARRKCEAHVLAGEVAVNGQVVRDLGRQVDLGTDQITFRGKPITAQAKVYYLLHKPTGYTTTVSDPHAEKTVFELLPEGLPRLFPVGRLDRDSTGLLLFTNDGDLANRLTHPRYGVAKVYEAKLDRPLDPPSLAKLRKGVQLEEGPARPEKVEALPGGMVRLLLREGRKREVRRVFEALGRHVVTLRRVSFGPLRLADLPLGRGRPLRPEEVRSLRRPGV